MTITVDVNPKEFELIDKAIQTFYIIKSDKLNDVGDTIIFQEQKDDGSYTNKEIKREITYIIADHKGLRPDWRTVGLKEKEV